MSTISVELPESLHKHLNDLAERDKVSVGQFVVLAIAEKLSVLSTEEYFGQRAARADKEKFKAVLNKVKDIEPDKADRL